MIKVYKVDSNSNFRKWQPLPAAVKVDISSLDAVLAKTQPHLAELGCSEIIYYDQDEHVVGAEFYLDEECTKRWDFAEFGLLNDIMVKVYPIGGAIIWEGTDNQELYLYL